MSQASPVDSQVLGHTVGWAQDAKNVFCLQKRHQPLLAHPESEVADCGQGHLQATTLQPADRKGGEAWRSLLSTCSSTRKEFGAHIGPLRVPTLTLGRAPHRNVPGGLGLFTSLDACHWEGKRGLKRPLYPLLQAPPPITTHRGSLLPLLLSGPRSQLLRDGLPWYPLPLAGSAPPQAAVQTGPSLQNLVDLFSSFFCSWPRGSRERSHFAQALETRCARAPTRSACRAGSAKPPAA